MSDEETDKEIIEEKKEEADGVLREPQEPQDEAQEPQEETVVSEPVEEQKEETDASKPIEEQAEAVPAKGKKSRTKKEKKPLNPKKLRFSFSDGFDHLQSNLPALIITCICIC